MHPPSWPHTPGDLQIHTHIFNHLGTWLTWNVTFTDSHIHTQTNASLLKLKSNTRGLSLPLYEVGRREIVTQCFSVTHSYIWDKEIKVTIISQEERSASTTLTFHILKPAFSFLLFGLSLTFYCFFDYMLYHCRLPLWVRLVWNLSACSRQVVQPAISSCSEAVPQLHTRAYSIFHFNVSGERNKLSCLSCLGTQIYSLSYLLQRVV